MNKDHRNVYGRDVISTLSSTYQQLYVPPGREGEKQYDEIVKCGRDAASRDLSHFHTHEKDSLVYEVTPAGSVGVVTLFEREDFVTFLRIMANRCTMAEIPDTQGAALLDGVINWDKIRAHKKKYISEEIEKGSSFPDWDSEFVRFTSDKENYKDALIVLSVGPYSGVSAESMNRLLLRSGQGDEKSRTVSEEEWLSLSDTIRRYHECTHFICRRKFADQKDAVWDELVADAAGISAAFHRFDPRMEELFLGIENGRYTGGRLENYVSDPQLDKMAARITSVLGSFESLIADNPGAGPYETAVMLEENQSRMWSW